MNTAEAGWRSPLTSVLYLRWDAHDVKNLHRQGGCVELFTEIDQHGRVLREVGLDATGTVVHCAPSKQSPYGLFDNQVVSLANQRSDIGSEAFGLLWQRATAS